MSEAYKKRMDELKEHTKLSHFEYEQLLCLKEIANRLLSIEDSLNKINHHLKNIEAK